MKFEQFLNEQYLNEAPLPDDWKADGKFKKGVPFTQTIKYAQERATKLGSGSSRVAFEVPYKGRDTVIKVAKNKKGIAQNYEEVQYLEDGYASDMGILIPLIDYDEESGDDVKWIHMEKADKIKDSDFVKYTGGFTCSELVWYCWDKAALNMGKRRPTFGVPKAETVEKALKHCKDNDIDLIDQLIDFLYNYDDGGTIHRDLTNYKNWGMYKGRPVIIDIGYNDTTAKLYARG